MKPKTLASFLVLAGLAVAGRSQTPMLPTGTRITPDGSHTGVGSFPTRMVLSPDGKYVVVTSNGFRQQLSVIDAANGKLVSKREFNANPPGAGREALYIGLAFGPAQGGNPAPLYVSRGTEDMVAVYTLGTDGTLTDTGRVLKDPPVKGPAHCPAGVGVSADGRTVFAANNNAPQENGLNGSLAVLDAQTGERRGLVTLPGYPLDIAVATKGPAANRKVFVTSERDGVVADVDPDAMTVRKRIATGKEPIALLMDGPQRRLFVANAASDTLSVIDTATSTVSGTLLLRPSMARGLPGATPTGLALDASDRRLYITLADMNAVAVVDVAGASPKLLGYVPTGWYPTSVLVAPDGKHLFVASAKGVLPRVPNNKGQGPDGKWGQYTLNILEGTVSRLAIPADRDLEKQTRRVLDNNLLSASTRFENPLPEMPIRYVIYIIKENRTYDQVLGDMPQGNGDPSLTLFGRKVTPNQHALAERFVLLDNFYCCAEVSADGWNWVASGMVNQNSQRNATYNYSGRGRGADFWGINSGMPVDLMGLPDVGRSPGGYLWDLCARHGIKYRNYGFFVENEITLPDGTVYSKDPRPNKRALLHNTNLNYRAWDLGYADSDAWVKAGLPDTVKLKEFGQFKSPSRFSEWRREYDDFVARGTMPRMMIVAMPRNHTEGTSPGMASPEAMVADNDYAVGQMVEHVSNGPFWKSTAIFVLEDDPQAGFDHVDCHRSTSFVISPYVKRAQVDSRFYNTDSVLRTMEILLGLPPMNRYDATAPVLDVFGAAPDNVEPYTAILPDKAVLQTVNGRTAYRAEDNARFDYKHPDAVPEQELNDILWHAVKGVETPKPPIVYGLFAHEWDEDDDD